MHGLPATRNEMTLPGLTAQVGFSSADLANLINEAAILAARANRKVIGMDELEEAIARVIAGPEKKSRRISKREKKVIAYHEVRVGLDQAHQHAQCSSPPGAGGDWKGRRTSLDWPPLVTPGSAVPRALRSSASNQNILDEDSLTIAGEGKGGQ